MNKLFSKIFVQQQCGDGHGVTALPCHCALKYILAAMTMIALTIPVMSQDEPEKKVTVREVFVPTGEMGTLLEQCKDRVLLSREEFESLLIESLKQSEAEPEADTPVAAVFLSSDLAITMEGEQARIKAVLEWESYTDKLHAEPLAFRAVAVQSALLNGEPAQLGFTATQGEDNRNFTLFWQGKGRQRLELELTTALTLDSVRQEVSFGIPRAPKATETLVVPGDVELKSGAMIVSRRVEGEGQDRVTRFELLAGEASQHLVLTLNSHRQRMIKSVLAKSVQFAEVTGHYEKLHATFSLDVLHQPIGTAEFVVPENFEMTDVISPQLAGWKVLPRDGRSILEVRFREPVGGQVPLNLTAVHFFDKDTEADALSEWPFPSFEPLDVNANSAVFGLLVDTNWNVHKIDATGLIAIAPQILRGTIPDSVFEASVDAPMVRTVAAWYAPNTDNFRILCEFLKPKPVFDVVSHQVLTLNDREQTMRGLFQLAPRYEKLFELMLDVPEHWTVTRVTDASDVPLPFEQKGGRVRVKVTSGIAPGTIFPVFFEASGNTPGWFSAWQEQQLAFPRFCLTDATGDSGTIAVDVDDDMIVTPENDVRLVPLDNRERTEFLAGLPTDLAFRYLSQPYSTDLLVTRATPRLAARTFAFYQFAPSLMSARYELHYTVEQARTKSLAFLLPIDTPQNIGITGLNGAAIKDYSASNVTIDEIEYRKWDVQLAEPVAGMVMLGVQFEQATPDETVQTLPLVTADGVAWQSGLISIEGHEELNLSLLNSETMRQVDVGELAATRYIPGKRLLGVFENNQSHDNKSRNEAQRNDGGIAVNVARNPAFQLPASLVQLARAEVEIAVDGKRITRAQYDLKTRATFLKVDLAANEEIWAVMLDGKTIKPQKSGSAILVDIPARNDAAIRQLEIIWATNESPKNAHVFAKSSVRLPDLMIPQNQSDDQSRESHQAVEPGQPLRHRHGSDSQADDNATTITWSKIPVTRVVWNITAPPGYEVTRIGRQRVEAEPPRPLVLRWLSAMFHLTPPNLPRPSWGIGCGSPVQYAQMNAADGAAKKSEKGNVADWAPASADLSSMDHMALGVPCSPVTDDEEQESSSDKKDKVGERLLELRVEVGERLREFRPDSSRSSEFGQELGSQDALLFDREERGKPLLSYQQQTLQTVRPVQVQFQQNLSSPLQRSMQFQLVGGSETQLKVRMVNTRLVTFGACLVWGGILCAGLWLFKASLRVRTIYVLAVLLAGTLLVLVPRLELFAGLCDAAVKAGLCVLLVYLLAGIQCKLMQNAECRMQNQENGKKNEECERRNEEQGTPNAEHSVLKVQSILLFCILHSALCISSHSAFGMTSADANDAADRTPIALPDDVIVAFYDAETLLDKPHLTLNADGLPDPQTLSQPGQKLLVPYQKYVELWNLVHPGEKVVPVEKPPVDYVTTFGEYRATLTAAEELSITGKTEIDVLADAPVLFPLPIGQGILTALSVDGKNAEVSISNPSRDGDIADGGGHAVTALPGIFVVQIHGKGKHVIDLTAKFKVERQGGWRLAAGRLPEIPAGKVLLELPEDRMELRCNDVDAQQKWQAKTPGETVETTLGQNGQFRWSWRSSVTEAEIDQSLTAVSELQFNVQEDALVLDWDLTLAFRRGKHESCRVRIPADYLVVSITGENVRGWENIASDSPDDTVIEIELLHAAQEVERFGIVLMRKADFADAKDVAVTTPQVAVMGAAMHHGRITLQNSPRLDVKTGAMANASMTDLPTDMSDVQNVNPTARKTLSDNPLGLKPYRAYRFTTENYLLPLVVNAIQDLPHISIDNVVKLSTHEVILESHCHLVIFSLQKRDDQYFQRLTLPPGLRLLSVTSEFPIEWSSKSLNSDETELTVLWTAIPANGITFTVRATATREPDGETDLPVITPQFQGHVSQYYVILTDPAFDVGVDEWENCTYLPNDPVPHWVLPEQRSMRRKQFSLSAPYDFDTVNPIPSFRMTLIPREPVITSESITNVQVNSRSVEEMILLDFNIENAGVRAVQFELPKSMADAKIDAPLLQRKEIVESENGETVTVTLHLQDEIMNEFRVLIRNNRELVSGKSYPATIPNILTGTVLNQYVVLENAGSLDELQVDSETLAGMRKISRQNREWANLAEILGGNATEAWLVAEKSSPKLSFLMVRRETVRMSGARIGLAETRVVLGENGDYLAEQIYRIDNKTEQFLDLKLPAGSQLWAVRLLTNQEWAAKQSGASGDFGVPVKPAQRAESREQSGGNDFGRSIGNENHSALSTLNSALVRIPIIKTEVGDLDYVVRVVYAGNCGAIRWASQRDIPLIEVLNIPVGSACVRLHLPENYKYQFDGTMRQSDQAAVSRTVSEFEQQVIADLQRIAQTGSPFEQARAMNNLKVIGLQKEASGFRIQDSGSVSGFIPEVQTPKLNALHNTEHLSQRFESQSNTRGKNVVAQSASNWDVPEGRRASAASTSDASGQQFSNEWFASNSLANPKSEKIADVNSDKSKDKAQSEQQAGIAYQNSLFAPADKQLSDDASDRPLPRTQSSRVSAATPQQQAQPQSLQSQQRLNDQNLASKLSGNQQMMVLPDLDVVVIDAPSAALPPPPALPPSSAAATSMTQQRIMTQLPITSSRQARAPGELPAPQATGQSLQQGITRGSAAPSAENLDSLELYQQRLAVQNANVPQLPQSQTQPQAFYSPPANQPGSEPAYGVVGTMGYASGQEDADSNSAFTAFDLRSNVGGRPAGSDAYRSGMTGNDNGLAMNGPGAMGGYGGGMDGSSAGGGRSGYGGGGMGGMGGGMGMQSLGRPADNNNAPMQMMVVPHIVNQEEDDTVLAGTGFSGFDGKPVSGPMMTSTMAAKYSSLDIEIPQTGTVYLFTAPQAEIRLSVSGVATATSQRMRDLGSVTLLLAVGAGIGFVVMRRKKRLVNGGQ